MLTIEDERALKRAEAFFIDPPDDWDDLETLDEEAFWDEADRRAEERWLEKQCQTRHIENTKE